MKFVSFFWILVIVSCIFNSTEQTEVLYAFTNDNKIINSEKKNMKKLLSIFFTIILTVIIFTGCGPLFPLDKDQFDIGDTVKVHIGEKVYESENFWVRVDSIHDGRCPIGMMCFWAGEAQVWLSVGQDDSIKQCYFSTFFDSLQTHLVSFGNQFQTDIEISLVEVNPYPILGVTPLKRNIWASFAVGNLSIDRKPNLYLYPEKKTKVSVSMDFPHGGKVIHSDPLYPVDWKNIKVKPDGKIDKKFDFLFYECEIPDFWQYVDGWVVKQEKLPEFFENNLKAYGFNDAEIEDFLEFWIPELKNSPYYEIFPQYTEMVNQVIKLHISPRPDKIMRLHYVIREFYMNYFLPVPEIPEFEAEGFVVREWGVILK